MGSIWEEKRIKKREKRKQNQMKEKERAAWQQEFQRKKKHFNGEEGEVVRCRREEENLRVFTLDQNTQQKEKGAGRNQTERVWPKNKEKPTKTSPN